MLAICSYSYPSRLSRYIIARSGRPARVFNGVNILALGRLFIVTANLPADTLAEA